MAICSFSHSDRTSEIGDRRPDTQVILYSVQCCYAVYWTDQNRKKSRQSYGVKCVYLMSSETGVRCCIGERQNTRTFRQQLKTWLFKKSFPDIITWYWLHLDFELRLVCSKFEAVLPFRSTIAYDMIIMTMIWL